MPALTQIGTSGIKDNAITTAKIVDSNVTSAKVADNAKMQMQTVSLITLLPPQKL